MNSPIRLLKLIMLTLLIATISLHSARWITRCESLHGQGRVYNAVTTQECSLIWEHLNFKAIQSLTH